MAGIPAAGVGGGLAVGGVGAMPAAAAAGGGAVVAAPGLFSMSTLTSVFENVVGGGVHMLSDVLRTGQALASLAALQMPDFQDISRTTVVGPLANPPDFNTAVADNGPALHAAYGAQAGAVGPAGGPTPAAAVLTALDVAFAASAGPTRAGVATALTAQDFHSALMHGAHFVNHADGGALYAALQAAAPAVGAGGGLQPRGSSHYPAQPAQQFGMDLPGGVGHLLIGLNNNGDTFFQLESHGVGAGAVGLARVGEILGHTQSYLQHIGSSDSYVQVGPHGCIEASEKDNNHIVL